jgi:hypothetical protein
MPADHFPLTVFDGGFDRRQTGCAAIYGVQRLETMLSAGYDGIQAWVSQQDIPAGAQNRGTGERHVAGDHRHQWLRGSLQCGIDTSQGTAPWDDIREERQIQEMVSIWMVGGKDRFQGNTIQTGQQVLDQRLPIEIEQRFIASHS